MVLKIAWRNIWRNKRRTVLTAASIFFAVFFAVSINSLNRGIFDKMIGDTLSFYLGFAQVHQEGYWEERSLDKSFILTDDLKTQLESTKGIDGLVPRLESFALASFGKITKSSMVVGVSPTEEDRLTGLAGRVQSGEYLKDGDEAVLISAGLADKLKMNVNDTIVLISQGYHGVNAAGKYAVKGIVQFGSPELNSTMIYMPLKTAQWFYGADQLINSVVLDIDNKRATEKALAALSTQLDTVAYELMDWKAMMPELMEMKSLKESSNFISIMILYLIVSFGIFGTILMMTKERMYEFGVLLSIGMKRGQLALAVWVETLMLGLLGALVGVFLSYGLMYYLMVNPIEVTDPNMVETYAKFGIEPLLPASVDGDLFYVQAGVVLLITTFLALYPCWKIWRMKPVESMRV